MRISSNIWNKCGIHLFKLFCFIFLFQLSIIINAQTKSDTLDIIKLYVDSVKLSETGDRRCLSTHWHSGKKHSEFPVSELSCEITTTTVAFPKKQRVDRTYIIRNGTICYYSEKRTKSIDKASIITHNEKKDSKNMEKVRKHMKDLMESPPCLEVYFYNGKILGYNTNNGGTYNMNPYKRSKKLTEKEIKKIIIKGGSNFGGIYQIIQEK